MSVGIMNISVDDAAAEELKAAEVARLRRAEECTFLKTFDRAFVPVLLTLSGFSSPEGSSCLPRHCVAAADTFHFILVCET